mmetsp:Transcript_21553/g.45137  ORF Transcript_21553/g.45137 Transcript_21553/m.45137 type:complete len:85 (-) Transcript_21553:26-280(-)
MAAAVEVVRMKKSRREVDDDDVAWMAVVVLVEDWTRFTTLGAVVNAVALDAIAARRRKLELTMVKGVRNYPSYIYDSLGDAYVV